MIDILKPLIQKFMPFARKQMGFSRPPKLFLRSDSQNAQNPLGKTGFYDPANESITLYITNRHPKDIMRSLAHELMHHTQKCNGDFDNVGNVGEQGYAQSDPHMRTMEIQAYKASIVFRDWEDSLKETIYYEHLQKGEKEMSTKDWKNREIGTLISEAWGFGFDVENLNEKKQKRNLRRGGSGRGHGAGDTGSSRSEAEGYISGKKSAKSKRGLAEDSGESEAWHEWKNEHADDDHIKEMEHHLRALKDDRDYERHGAEDDDDKYEDEGYDLDEGEGSKKGEYKRRKKKGKVGKRAGDVGGHYKDYMTEDSGEEEAWHDWKNEHADDNHIKELEHHLRALKEDRDYERKGAEYDHDKYEDEGDPQLDEMCPDSHDHGMEADVASVDAAAGDDDLIADVIAAVQDLAAARGLDLGGGIDVDDEEVIEIDESPSHRPEDREGQRSIRKKKASGQRTEG